MYTVKKMFLIYELNNKKYIGIHMYNTICIIYC